MTVKQAGEHAHEVELEDGRVVMSGPPVELAAEEPDPAAQATGELGLEEPPAGQTRRAKRGAIPRSVELAKTLEVEAQASAKALQSGDVDALPPEARKIWDRMVSSSKRFLELQGEKDDRYCEALGWRAVRQRYNLGQSRRAPAAKRRIIPVRRKYAVHANVVDGVRGGAWVVHLAGDKMADVLYERVEQIPLPSYQGAAVTVGYGPGNHRNLLNVLVPRRLVTEQAGAVGPIKFVQNNWDEIYRVGKGERRYLLVRDDRTKRAPRAPGLRRLVHFKGFGERGGNFTTDPRQATKRIAFGENYVPYEVDLQGEYASHDEVAAFAYGFMKDLARGVASPGEMHARWVMPDGSPAGYPVESFIVRRGDPDFPIEGSWVTGTEFHPEVWEKIETGEYRGYSIGGHWGTTPIEGRAA